MPEIPAREQRESEWFLGRFDEITDAVAPRCTDPVVNEAYRLLFAQRAHIDTDHKVMVQLGQIADAAVQMLEHIHMDTGEDREFHARAVGALRARLDEMAATMKEANEAAGTICRCALEKGRMLHRGDCPLYPGEPLRLNDPRLSEEGS